MEAQPFIRRTKYGPEVVHPKDCATCDGVGSLEAYVFWSAGQTRTVACDDCDRGTVEDAECDCAGCTFLCEEAGAECRCGTCGYCKVLRCNALGPITEAEHVQREEAMAEARRELEQERVAKSGAVLPSGGTFGAVAP